MRDQLVYERTSNCGGFCTEQSVFRSFQGYGSRAETFHVSAFRRFQFYGSLRLATVIDMMQGGRSMIFRCDSFFPFVRRVLPWGYFVFDWISVDALFSIQLYDFMQQFILHNNCISY